MNIQQFKYVLAIVDSNNFESAAEKCFVTQSTLSTMVVKFEDEIGIKIFNRKTKPVSVTKDGKEIIKRLRFIVNELESLDSVIKELKGEISGEIKIGVIPTIAPYLLPFFLSKFSNKYPNLDITIKEITTPKIEEGLLNRTIDIGIMALPIKNKNLQGKELYKEPFLIYDCSEEIKEEKEISINQLDSSKLWLLQEGHCMRTQVERICKLTNDNNHIKFKFESASMSSLLNFTKHNNGITIIPSLSLNSVNLTKNERIINFKNPVPTRLIGIVTHQYFSKKQLLKILEENIKNTVNGLIPKNIDFEIIEP